MENFIKVIPNALEHHLCDALIHKFDINNNCHEGFVGGGIDTSKKRSRDLSISREQDFKSELQSIIQVTTTHLVEYFDYYYFALIAPLGIKIKKQNSDSMINVTAENYKQLARPILRQLVAQFFRLGEINMQHYSSQTGGYPYWHSESYPDPPQNEALHRVLLFMYYLNNVDAGGETDFFYQQLSIKPCKGTMVIAPAYFTHTHRGNVPLSGDKYIITSWVMFKRGGDLFRS